MAVDENAATFAAENASVSGARSVLGARYELLGLLGSGGMGNVYRARDLELDEVVALKVLRPELVGAPGTLERFRREVKLARRVTHPNVARVFDIGEHGGDKILTMELVDGESLGGRLQREGRLPFDETVRIARAICAGVGAAHEAGVVHRDLKPENVLLAKDGRVVVTDFGIARAAAEGARTVGFVGTPAYMAPEQIDERATIDHRADIYAFGALVYELLTGEAAWQAESLWAIAAKRLLEPPPDPRERRVDIPTALATLVVRCMARDAAARPASMREIDGTLASVALPTASSTSPTPVPAPRDAGFVTTGTDKRVAVLPFANVGPKEDEYVADGLTEDLIDALSVARGLRVRSRGMVMTHKGQSRDARDVGRELDVHVVVEGSVRRGPGGFRINARLVSVSDGFQLWARRFDVPENELLVQNDVIARAVAEALGAAIAGPARAAAADASAVDLYLRGREAHHRAFSIGAEVSIQLFEEALRHAPDDPKLLAARATAGALSWIWDPASRQATLDAGERALALAPALPEAHIARGRFRFLDGDRLGAVMPLRRALRLAPASGEAHEAIGRILSEADLDEGLRHQELAITLEPTLEFSYIGVASHYAYRGEWERANEVLAASTIQVPIESRYVAWRRDAARAKELLAKLPTMVAALPARNLMLAKGWLELTAYGTRMPPPPSGGPPLPPELRAFIGEVQTEEACFVGELARAEEVLRRLDAGGHAGRRWLERCPLLDTVRELPWMQPIRAHFAERAAAIHAEYRRPLD